MEIVLARFNNSLNKMEEIKELNEFIKFNMVLSKTADIRKNDFELQMSERQWNKNKITLDDWLYIPNTEWGGVVEGIEHTSGVVKLTGLTFRGRLAKKYIMPEPIDKKTNSWKNRVNDYIDLNLDANRYLEKLYFLNYSTFDQYAIIDPFVMFDSATAGVMIKDSVRFDSFLERITRILSEHDMRLQTKHFYHDYADPKLLCEISAVPIVDYSSTTFINEDYDIEISSKLDNSNRREFCICLGRGEMKERDIYILYKDLAGNIRTGEPFMEIPDFLSNTIVYDNANAENVDELIEGGKKRLQEEYNEVRSIEFEIKNDDFEFFLGDKIGGSDAVTGVSGIKEIVEKELTINNDRGRVTYRLE